MSLLLLVACAGAIGSVLFLLFLAGGTGTSHNDGIATGDTAPRPCCVENYCRTPHKDEHHA